MSAMDLFDLANSVRLKNPIEEIARFLCRSRREVREKVAELERSGELARRIEEAAANTLPE
jgi:predicted transcriptional regulator